MEGSFKLQQGPNSSVKLPKFLKGNANFSLSSRPRLPIDEKIVFGQDLDARDVTKGKPSHRFKTYRKVQRRLAEAEELHEYMTKRLSEDRTTVDLDLLEKALNGIAGIPKDYKVSQRES